MGQRGRDYEYTGSDPRLTPTHRGERITDGSNDRCLTHFEEEPIRSRAYVYSYGRWDHRVIVTATTPKVNRGSRALTRDAQFAELQDTVSRGGVPSSGLLVFKTASIALATQFADGYNAISYAAENEDEHLVVTTARNHVEPENSR